jgi:hypothetical protein
MSEQLMGWQVAAQAFDAFDEWLRGHPEGDPIWDLDIVEQIEVYSREDAPTPSRPA